jgi:ribosomal protein L9
MEVTMSLTPNARRRQAFLFGRAAALRSTNDVVDQLEAQLHAEREQHAAHVAELERVRAVLSKELLEVRYELAKGRVADAFAAKPSPSGMLH